MAAEDRPERLADLRHRVGDVRAFLGNVAKLLYGVSRDPRVPRSAKLLAVGATAYAISPLDVLPDLLPVIGRLDDLWLVGRSLRYLIQRAGYDVVREHWQGTEDQFAVLLVVAGVSE